MKPSITELATLSRTEPVWLKKFRLNNLAKYLSSAPAAWKYGRQIAVNAEHIFSQLELNNSPKDFIVSKDSIEIFKIKEAAAKYKNLPALIANDLTEDKLSFLHNSFFKNLFVVNIEERKKLLFPVELNFDSGIRSVIIFVAPFSSVDFLEKNFNIGFSSTFILLIVGEGSKVRYFSSFKTNSAFTRRKAVINSNALLEFTDFATNTGFIQSNTKTTLIGAGSSVSHKSLFYLGKNAVVDFNSEAVHEAEYTKSNILAKAALKDSSRFVSRGLVSIKKDKKMCNGYEKTDILMLSPGVRADVMPRLAINNNEVKCTHGVSIKKINPEEIYYLQTRGLSEETAKKTIVDGFFSEISSEFDMLNDKTCEIPLGA